MIKKILPFFCVLFLTACSATGPLFTDAGQIPAGKGRVYVFRPHIHAMSVVKAQVSVDQNPVIELDDNGYTVIDLPPGSHEFTHSWGKKFYTTDAIINRPFSIFVPVSAGMTNYILLSSTANTSLTSLVPLPFGILMSMKTEYAWAMYELPATVGREQIVTTRFQPLVIRTEGVSQQSN